MTALTEETQPQATGLRISRRHLMIGAAFAGASLAAQAALPKPEAPRVDKKAFANWIPRKFGPWTSNNGNGIVLPPPDVLSDRLYDDLASMTYIGPGGVAVMVALAYNYQQDGVVQIHRPEVCYPTGGYTLSGTEALAVDVAPGREVPANFFTATGPHRIEQVLYWTRIGPRFPRSWVDQRLSVVMSNLRGAIPDGILARFSVIGSDRDAALAQLRAFIPEFVAASNTQLRRIMVGAL